MTPAAFTNEPLLELRRRVVRDELERALAALDQTLPRHVPLLIGGDAAHGEQLSSTDPGEPERLVALAPGASLVDASAAVETASAAAADWARAPASVRAGALVRAASWMRERRHTLAALCVRECAKPWPEADADVAEAIDHLEYYARGALALDAGAELAQVHGERNTLTYGARGVCAVIAPWNFPLAIPAGMVGAALATGNSVVFKPAEQAFACGAMVVQALREGGVPAGALALLPGDGDAGAALVGDPRVHTIAFTGSAAVGLQIIREAAEPRSGQHHVKRVIAEMGGKNCVIVDADADLDEAVPAILRSAFVYAGQKCSAASRVLVHHGVGESLIARLAGGAATLQVGQAQVFATDVPPLIEREARERVSRFARIAEADGELVARHGEPLPAHGWFCPITVVRGLPPDSPVLGEEIFGPLLAVELVASVEEALARVEQLPFALTGGLFSRNPRTVELVRESTPVGNLYVNRHITGAMVGRQPFGGNRLSGSGFKAGGPDYLLQFVQACVTTENVLRHGLVV